MSLSIIIAAYNIEAYIEECLESLIPITRQETDIEIIVVNDGSTDSTREKIVSFQSAHPDALLLIDQENRGLSAARNAGIKAAKGRYLFFVDGDDTILPDAEMPWHLINSEEDYDILGIEIMQQDERNGRKSLSGPKPYRRYKSPIGIRYAPARDFLAGRNIMPMAVSYIVRRKMIMDNGILFREGIFHEDEDYTLRLFLTAGSFIASGREIYCYRLRTDSITSTEDKAIQKKKIRDVLSILRDSQTLPYKEYANYKIHYLAVDILRILIRQHHSKSFQREVISSLRAMHLFPLPWHWETKYILFRIITSLLFSRLK